MVAERIFYRKNTNYYYIIPFETLVNTKCNGKFNFRPCTLVPMNNFKHHTLYMVYKRNTMGLAMWHNLDFTYRYIYIQYSLFKIQGRLLIFSLSITPNGIVGTTPKIEQDLQAVTLYIKPSRRAYYTRGPGAARDRLDDFLSAETENTPPRRRRISATRSRNRRIQSFP